MDLYAFFLVLCMATLSSGMPLSVMDFGAVGDGRTDDSQAFMKAWTAVCGATTDSTLIIPESKMFLLQPVQFIGPCKSPSIHIQIQGTIIAPSKMSDWKTCYMGTWIVFTRVNGLTIDGNGQIDGRGDEWWKNCGSPDHSCPRPYGLKLDNCNNVIFSGLKVTNSPSRHISVSDCKGATLSNLNIFAPENSPNTDGIDITHSKSVTVRDCTIGTGDDCIAILSGTANLNISGVKCGPGHGISIGSLGAHGDTDIVEEVHVKNCTFLSTLSGARIKTWQGGAGYARKISFDDIKLIKTNNPIYIDQFYCPHSVCANQTSAVKISDVSFTRFQGTSLTNNAITIQCSQTVGCTGIVLDQINITSAVPNTAVTSSCLNAHGVENVALLLKWWLSYSNGG